MSFVSSDAVRLIEDKMRSLGFKDERHGNWRGNHPGRSGSDSHGLRVTITQVGDGKWNVVYSDHARASEGGGAEQLAKYLGVELPKPQYGGRQLVASTKRAYRDLEEYALLHGIPAAALRAAGWRDCEDVYDGSPNHKKLRPALPFKTPSGMRYRFIDGEKPYYKSTAGYHACWFMLDEAIAMAAESRLPLVLCNGEISTAVAQHFGIPATCQTAGEKRIADDLLPVLKEHWQGAIVLAYDCDQAGQKTAQDVKTQLSNAAIIDLHLSDGGDLADFCKLYTGDSVQRFQSLFNQKPTEQSQAGDLSELRKNLKALKEARDRDDKSEVLKVLDATQHEIDSLNRIYRPPKKRTGREVVDECRARLKRVIENPNELIGLSSGLGKLDYVLGGLNGSIVIYGATSMGKSTLLSTIGGNLSYKQRIKGYIVPTETTPGDWLDKMVASITSINNENILRGSINPNEKRRIDDAYDILENHVDFLEETEPSPATVRTAVIDAVKAGAKYVMFDSISNLTAGHSAIYDDTRAVSRAIQNLNLELKTMGFNIPFISTAQVDTATAKRARVPNTQDAKGGGDIGRDADVVLALYYHWHFVEQGLVKPNDKFPEKCALLRIAKNRWGAARSVGCKMLFMPGMGFYDWQEGGHAQYIVAPNQYVDRDEDDE